MELLLLFAAGLATGLALCWLRINMAFPAQSPEDYNSARKTLDLRQHLQGKNICEGAIFGPFGRVTSRFVAEFDGRWDGDTGRITERFVYDTGETQTRQWHIEIGKNGRVEARADDVVGVGTGHQAGSALGMTYRLRLPDNSGGHVLDATDWMYLLDNGTIVNRSQFRKFGFTVAELVATIRPATSDEEATTSNTKTQDMRTAA